MKEFDLELAKAGHPVQTRDGRKVKILCFDRIAASPIVALVKIRDTLEKVYTYCDNGICMNSHDSIRNDLMMASEKCEGWVNIYLDTDRNIPYCCEWIFPTKEDAERYDANADRKIATTKITWIEE